MLRVCQLQQQAYKTSSRVFYCQLRRLQLCHCVQLNSLFCCIWRNVEASCHKHFVVFPRNQHRRLLPAKCHNLRDGTWPWSTGDRVYNTQPIAALTQAVKPDIGSESRFLPTPPAFDAPRVPVGILLCRLARKNQKDVATDSKKMMIRLFVLTQLMNVTDGQTPHDDTGRACIASRSKNDIRKYSSRVHVSGGFIILWRWEGFCSDGL